MRAFFLFMISVFVHGPVLAGTIMKSSEKDWDIYHCMDYALENNPGIKAALENIKIVEGANDVLKSEFIPKLSAGYAALKNNYSSPLVYTREQKEKMPPSQYSDEVYTASVSLSDTLYSKKMSPTFSMVNINLEMARSKVRQAKNDLILQVKKAFYTVLFTQQTYKISRAAESVAKDNHETSQALFKEGKVSSFDVSRAKVRWISARADSLSAKNSNIVALEALKTLLSIPQDEHFEITGSFPIELKEQHLDQSIKESLEFRPELEQMTLVQRLKKDSLEIARSGYFPSVNASLNYAFSSPDMDVNFPSQYDSWSATLSVSIPIFDGFQTRGRLKTARSELNQADLNREALEDAVLMEVRQAYFTLKNTKESLSAQKESVSIAKENLKIAKERYSMGLLSLLELKDVELSLIAAETQYVKTLYDYNTAFVGLERAVGLPYRS